MADTCQIHLTLSWNVTHGEMCFQGAEKKKNARLGPSGDPVGTLVGILASSDRQRRRVNLGYKLTVCLPYSAGGRKRTPLGSCSAS